MIALVCVFFFIIILINKGILFMVIQSLIDSILFLIPVYLIYEFLSGSDYRNSYDKWESWGCYHIIGNIYLVKKYSPGTKGIRGKLWFIKLNIK